MENVKVKKLFHQNHLKKKILSLLKDEHLNFLRRF